MKWIIPLVLTEDDVLLLSDEVMDAFAECATDKVKVKISQYLSDSDTNQVARNKVLKAFERERWQTEFMTSEFTQECVTLLKDLSYLDVTAYTDKNLLKKYIDAIEYIINNEHAVPYIEPKDKEDFEELKTALRSLSEEYERQNKCIESSTVMELYRRVDKMKKLFYDPKGTPYKGTPVKKILRDRQKYKIILRGAKFLLSKREMGASPSSWRYL